MVNIVFWLLLFCFLPFIQHWVKMLHFLTSERHMCCHVIWLVFPAAFTFFDPNDPACLEILMDPRTTIPELFAIIRQWVPQVQHKIDIIGNEVLLRTKAQTSQKHSTQRPWEDAVYSIYNKRIYESWFFFFFIFPLRIIISVRIIVYP